jgi:hypothetical protein
MMEMTVMKLIDSTPYQLTRRTLQIECQTEVKICEEGRIAFVRRNRTLKGWQKQVRQNCVPHS